VSNQDRVTHSVRGYTMKFGQVQKRIAETSCFVWVDAAKTLFRDATIAEAAEMRKEQVKPDDGLVYYVEDKDGKPIAKPLFAELPGVIYQPAERNIARTRASYELLARANRFCLEHA
jgi:hypothetical protein